MVQHTVYITVYTCFICFISTVYCLTDYRLLQKRDTSDLNRDSLQNTIKGIDNDLAFFQKRTCAFGINSHHCTLVSLDDKMRSQAWLSDGMSPGKRSGLSPDMESKALSVLDDIANKRKALLTIQEILTGLPIPSSGQSSPSARKRSCRLRLGGMCLTESLDAAANQYEYLSSAHSPGRKKRSLRH